jgi:hypothetical protein
VEPVDFGFAAEWERVRPAAALKTNWSSLEIDPQITSTPVAIFEVAICRFGVMPHHRGRGG